MAAKKKAPPSELDLFFLREFFQGKSVSVIARDYCESHNCSKGEAQELIYNALFNYAYDYDFAVF
jgi:hypothetical protein